MGNAQDDAVAVGTSEKDPIGLWPSRKVVFQAMPMHRFVPVTAGIATTLALGLVSIASATSASAIDTSSKVSVATAYLNNLVPAEKVPIGWTGSVAGCKTGSTSAAQRYATKTAINFFRGMGGLKGVTLDSALSAKSQQAALMMQANNTLSHSPPSSWTCYTDAGKEAAGSSNLSLGVSGAKAISGYMVDPGSGNNVAGHRRWIMYPPLTKMGSGSTASANSLWVFGGGWTMPSGTPTFVSWPTSGYFPAGLEPAGRWSLSATDSTIDFAAAKITVKNPSGTSLSVSKQPVANGYGNNTVVFEVSGITKPSGSAVSDYVVTVSDFNRTGSTTKITRTYTVKLFNPANVAKVAIVSRPSITGTAKVGHTLKSGTGKWSPTPTSYAYRWLRNGAPIASATARSYKLVAADKGTSITVQVTARLSGRVSGVNSSVAKTVS